MEQLQKRLAVARAALVAGALLTVLIGTAGCHSAPPAFVGAWEAKGIRTGMIAYTRLTFRADGTGQEYVDFGVPGIEPGASQPDIYPITWHVDGNHMVINGGASSDTSWSVTDDGAYLTLPNAPMVTYSRVASNAALPPVF